MSVVWIFVTFLLVGNQDLCDVHKVISERVFNLLRYKHTGIRREGAFGGE